MFQRSIVEILYEFEQRTESMPDLQIEEDLLLYYPLPMYFWFSNTQEGKHLAARVKEGMIYK